MKYVISMFPIIVTNNELLPQLVLKIKEGKRLHIKDLSIEIFKISRIIWIKLSLFFQTFREFFLESS